MADYRTEGSRERTTLIMMPTTAGFFVRWFMSTNHKDIGTLYLIFAIVAGIIGGGISGIMRARADASGPPDPEPLPGRSVRRGR